ncbi:MAG: outer membrane lipoprotein carrier protein LolA [Flavobacteriales bacterium]|nr:outer membrane lipoprotein carrier protein LolA [Flavobacteriales bacterium]
MSNRIILFVFLFMGLSIWPQEVPMSSSEAANFKAKVEKANQNISNIKTDFIQKKHLAFLTNDIESSGKMLFKAPNYLKWSYSKPFQYSIEFKNNKVLIDDQGKKSSIDIGNSKVFEKINKMIVGSVSGQMFDEKEFEISYFKVPNGVLVKLISITEMKKYIKEVNLLFPVSSYTVSEVKLVESSDDYTLIQFKNKQQNVNMD